MPSIDAPRHYEVGSLMPSTYDFVMKWLSSWTETYVGVADAPGGAVSLLEVTEDDYKAYQKNWPYDNFPQDGWYLTVLTDNGLICAFDFGSGTLAEENARRMYAQAEAAYAAWEESQAQHATSATVTNNKEI